MRSPDTTTGRPTPTPARASSHQRSSVADVHTLIAAAPPTSPRAKNACRRSLRVAIAAHTTATPANASEPNDRELTTAAIVARSSGPRFAVDAYSAASAARPASQRASPRVEPTGVAAVNGATTALSATAPAWRRCFDGHGRRCRRRAPLELRWPSRVPVGGTG